MRGRDFQSRLDIKHSIIKRKILNNQVELAGNTTDIIRLTVKRNDEGDIESRIVSKADVINVIIPNFKEVPIRKLKRNLPDGHIDETVGSYTITSLTGIASEDDTNYSEAFKVYFPHNVDLNKEDYLIHVFLDPDVEDPIVIVLKVSELLGTFTHSMLLWESAICTLDVENIPPKLANVIGSMAERRLHIKF